MESTKLKNSIQFLKNRLVSNFSPSMLFRMAITDYSFHSLPFFYSNQEYLDFLWHNNNGDIIPYILGKNNSSHISRQVLSSYSRFYRYKVTNTFSELDPFISNILGSIFQLDYFSPKSANIRNFRRKMLTCVRNRGVYADLANIILQMHIQTPYARKMAKNYPLFDRSIKVFQNFDNSVGKKDHNKIYIQNKSRDYKMSFDQIKNLFEKETNYAFDSVFSAFSEKPSSVRNDVAEYDAVLSTGEDVTISVIPPNLLRLRHMDLFPARSLLFFLDFLGFDTKLRKRYQYYMSRLNFDFKKEVYWRKNLLTKYRINFMNTSPGKLFESVRSLQLPLCISAPLENFSSKHLMVTERKPMYYVRSLSIGNVHRLMKCSSEFLFEKNFVIPDMSPFNIKIEKNKTAIDRVFSMKTLTRNEVDGFAFLVAASALDSDVFRKKAINLLDLNSHFKLFRPFGSIRSFIEPKLNGEMANFSIDTIEKEKNGNCQMVIKHVDALYALAEMRLCLHGNLQSAGEGSFDSLHYFSKPIAEIVGAGPRDEKKIFLYLKRKATEIIA